MNSKRMLVFGFSAVIVFLALQPAHAQNPYKGWRFRAFAGVVCRCVESDNVTFTDPFFGTSATEVDGTGVGFGVDVERRFSKLLGFDLAISYTDLDVQFKQSLTPTIATDTIEVLPIWLAELPRGRQREVGFLGGSADRLRDLERSAYFRGARSADIRPADRR